jgi:hypothetical protein
VTAARCAAALDRLAAVALAAAVERGDLRLLAGDLAVGVRDDAAVGSVLVAPGGVADAGAGRLSRLLRDQAELVVVAVDAPPHGGIELPLGGARTGEEQRDDHAHMTTHAAPFR